MRQPALGRWILRTCRCVRTLCLLAAVGASTLVISSLAGKLVASPWARVSVGLGAALLVPLLARSWLRGAARRRFGKRLRLGGHWALVGWNLLLLSALCLGFSDTTGQALRRRGDWFLGERTGWAAQSARQLIVSAGRWMERFDLPQDLPPGIGAALAAALSPPLPPLPDSPPPDAPPHGRPPHGPLPHVSPPRSPSGRPVVPARASWFHPLAGPRRVMPPNASCRFGAPRPGRRPRECDLGHCGVDFPARVGTAVHAIHDGVVLSAVRDERRGGRAGRYVKLGHEDGLIKSYYVHLDQVRADLRPGVVVRGGERIGTIGLTGVERSAPHLHFGIAVRLATAPDQPHEARSGQRRFRYVDPEPLVRSWTLPRPHTEEQLFAAL